MARARQIKPGFFINPELVELPFETRLLFPGLWVLADRLGRLEDRPKLIKMQIFPADSVDINDMLNQLQSAGLIVRYEVDGNKYIEIINFEKHQNPHKDERASTIPAQCKHGANTVLDSSRHQTDPACTHNLEPITSNLDKNTVDSMAVSDPTADEFEEAWSIYPQRPGRSKADAFRAWKARVKEGVNPALLIDGVKRYAAYCRGTNTDPQYVKQPATFFGPGQHYLSDWAIPSARASPRDIREAEGRRVIEVLTGKGNHEQRIERDITVEVMRIAG